MKQPDAYAKFGAVRPPYCSLIFNLFLFITRKWTLSMAKFKKNQWIWADSSHTPK